MRSHDQGTLKVSDWRELHNQNWRCIDFKDDPQRTIDPLKTNRYSLALRSNRYHEDVCPRKNNVIPKYGGAQIHLMKVWQPNTFGDDSIFKSIRRRGSEAPLVLSSQPGPQPDKIPPPPGPPPWRQQKRQILDEGESTDEEVNQVPRRPSPAKKRASSV